MGHLSEASAIELQLIHWLLVLPAIILCTLLVTGKRIWKLSFPALFIAGFLIMIYGQAVNIYLEEVASTEFLISIWAVPFLYLGGYAFARFLVRGASWRVRSTAPADVSIRDLSLSRFMPFITAAIILLPIIYILDRGTNAISLFFLITNPGSAIEAMNLRIDGLNSNIHPLMTLIYSYGRALILPTYAGIVAVLWRRRLISTKHFISGLAAAIFFSLMTAAKSPMTVVIASAATAVFVSQGCSLSRRSVRLLAVCFAIALVFPSVIYPLAHGKSGSEGVVYIFEQLFRRITWIPSWCAASYFDAFGQYFPFLGFSSNRLLASIAGEPFRSAPDLMYGDYLQGSRSIEGGGMNAAFFASLYADWAMPGVVIGTLVVGAIVGFLESFFDSRKADLTSTAIKGVVLVATGQMLITNIYSTVLGFGFLSLPLFLAIYDLFTNKTLLSDKNVSLASRYPPPLQTANNYAQPSLSSKPSLWR